MRIHIATLREITIRILSHVEEQGIDSIELKKDYYWNVPTDQLYDNFTKPSDLNVGQLFDDWKELLQIHSGESEPLGYALVWLAAIMRFVGEENVS